MLNVICHGLVVSKKHQQPAISDIYYAIFIFLLHEPSRTAKCIINFGLW